jgi:hypothetical protein
MLNYSKRNVVAIRDSGTRVNRSSAKSGSTLLSRCTVLSSLLGMLAMFGLAGAPQNASAVGTSSLTLAWDRNLEADVVGYRVYYGPASRQYTNSIYVGNVTSNLISGLTGGAAYYFAMTAIDATGLESDYSAELMYSPPGTGGGPKVKVKLASNRMAILSLNGTIGQAYDFLATTNMTTWTVLGTSAVASDGQAIFVDSAAPNHRIRYYRARLK